MLMVVKVSGPRNVLESPGGATAVAAMGVPPRDVRV